MDPQVSVFISRDLDSSITAREVAAVEEWLQSENPLHLMRDNPAHCFVPILAGMWGTRTTEDTIRQEWVRSIENIVKDNLRKKSSYGTDQILLKKWVWPWVKSRVMQHDSYWYVILLLPN